MALCFDENLQFVLLIAEHKEVLEKSQVPSLKKKKEEAVQVFIEKWSKLCGKELAPGALLKKVHNLKTRAKAASVKNIPLSSWQMKILELTKVSNV